MHSVGRFAIRDRDLQALSDSHLLSCNLQVQVPMLCGDQRQGAADALHLIRYRLQEGTVSVRQLLCSI